MLLEFKSVTGKNKKFKLDHISFALEAGYMMGLAGKNGAGKTTLVRYILDETYRFDGEILIDGKSIKANRQEALDAIGFVSEENTFFGKFSIHQNVELLGPFYSKWDKGLFEAYLSQMGLYLGQKVGGLSRGEYMKFQLAFAMAHKPKLYILDEATAGMDPIFRKEFFKFLRQTIQKEEASILMITHIEEELDEKMDYVGIMEQGRLISFKTTL